MAQRDEVFGQIDLFSGNRNRENELVILGQEIGGKGGNDIADGQHQEEGEENDGHELGQQNLPQDFNGFEVD